MTKEKLPKCSFLIFIIKYNKKKFIINRKVNIKTFVSLFLYK